MTDTTDACQRGECESYRLIPSEKLVVCVACGAVADPFDVLLLASRNDRKLEKLDERVKATQAKLDKLMTEEAQKKKALSKLQRELESTRIKATEARKSRAIMHSLLEGSENNWIECNFPSNHQKVIAQFPFFDANGKQTTWLAVDAIYHDGKFVPMPEFGLDNTAQQLNWIPYPTLRMGDE